MSLPHLRPTRCASAGAPCGPGAASAHRPGRSRAAASLYGAVGALLAAAALAGSTPPPPRRPAAMPPVPADPFAALDAALDAPAPDSAAPGAASELAPAPEGFGARLEAATRAPAVQSAL